MGNKVIWNEKLKGDATYKGEVLAHLRDTIRHRVNGGVEYAQEKVTPLAKDGQITLNAHFADRLESSYIKGEINSALLGKIVLDKTTLINANARLANDNQSFNVRGEVTANIPNTQSGYTSTSVGNFDAKLSTTEAVGTVKINQEFPLNINQSSRTYDQVDREYNAVFGATRQ